MRSGGSCWSWLWWDLSSFWSWSSLYCCMDKAPSTRPVAQVCGHTVVMFYRLTFSCLEMCYISNASVLSSVSLTLFHSQSTGAPHVPSADLLQCTPASEKLRHASLHVHCLSSKVACSSLVPTGLPPPLRPSDRGKLGQPCSFTKTNQDKQLPKASQQINAKNELLI